MNIYTGTAVIDRKLQIARADEQFYEYIGTENYASVAGNIHPDALAYFKKSVEDIQEGETRVFVVRFKSALDEEYHHVFTEIKGMGVKEEWGSYVELKLQDVNLLGERLAKLCDENSLYDELLEVWGEHLFVYEIASDKLEIFSGGSRNRIYNYRGSLQEFKDKILSDKLVLEEYREDFDEFCNALAIGVKNFQYRLLLLDEGIDPEQNYHMVKGKTIKNSQEEAVVLGCISRRLKNGAGEEAVLSEYETDVTTGLLTKKAILEYTENLLRKRPKYNVNLCVIDVDNFKAVNDTLGHMFGDEVLATIANILKDSVAGKGLVGRIGGDEMFVVLEGVNEMSDLRGVLRSIRNNVEWAYKERKEVPRVTCSIGVSTYPDDGDSYDDLFQIADKMLYRAKQKGKNRYIVYAPEIHGDVLHGGEDALIQNNTTSKKDKEDVVLQMLTYATSKRSHPFEMLLREIGTAFALDEIHLVYGEENKVMLENSWDADGVDGSQDRDISFVQEENFSHLYREHNMAVIDKLDLIAQLCPETHRFMTRHNIKAALIYKMNCQNHEGYITYYKKSEISRKWGDSDIANLTYISKVIELVINDR